MVQAVRHSRRSYYRKKTKLHPKSSSGTGENVQPGEVSIRDPRDTPEVIVLFIKLNNGTDLICRYVKADDDFLIVTEILQFIYSFRPNESQINVSMMKWLPIDSLFSTLIPIHNYNILTVLPAPIDIATQYLNSIIARNANINNDETVPEQNSKPKYLH